jgi:hypothetical protein
MTMGRPRTYTTDAERQRAYRQRRQGLRAAELPSSPAIRSSLRGTNADLIAEVARLYIKDGAIVVDPTFGKGVFWRKTDTSRFTLLASDLMTCPERPYDFRHLPYADGSIDVLTLDPPYVHDGGTFILDAQYQNATTRGMNHAAIIRLYQEGMTEAWRVIRSGGQLFVKCKDEIESGVQRWSHIEIAQIARALGFCMRDLAILFAQSRMIEQRWTRQIHARKDHSYLWVFGRP